ncbi:MAG: alpha-L-fucosidase [Edaphobacter sp.]|uniref:alpha-L-fucosidase n=1 Tax=Edaphobacter sp. TaxID=1934404 RepID=UPI0023A38C6A|nr:alpha-L-fucosidase [Edaphobacter sp.]MDE1175264.1 alpha-L-fucosidase [Edaphobacter sp.]
MKLTRRDSLKLFAAATPSFALRPARAFAADLPIAAGPFQGTRSSLAGYKIPSWFGEAKFGIWSHWGPQSAIEDGDWYARNMYVQGSDQYKYHLKTYGHPSKVGYKDLVPQFKAARWDPDHLMDLYVKAGAKYFFSMGVHHDNYDMWNSKYQKRWNAVATGPNKDIVGIWKNAARKRGLRFGVSEHLSNSYDWFATSHTSDSTGPLAGVPYDGVLPAYADLYHDYTGEPADFVKTAKAMGRVAPTRWKQEYFNRIKDLLDQHQPDLLYTDGGIPFEEYGLSLVAHLYNLSAKKHGGKVESIYFSKTMTDCENGTCALDRERGVLDDIAANPWQTDTCVGEWHYRRGVKYKSAKKVIDLLVDIVSKNGNLLLNFPLPNSGELDPEEVTTLEGITAWMQINSEGIYASRPWKIYGEGPSTKVVIAKNGKEFDPNEGKKPDLGAQDIRFTTKGKTLYAFVQGWPAGEAVVTSLGTGSPHAQKVVGAHMLGYSESLKFTQRADGLHVTMPSTRPASADIGIALKLTVA